MYIFTPNTIVKSSEMNANFASALDITNHVNPYYFYATLASNQTTVATTWTKLNMTSEVTDPNGDYDSTNAYYEIPITGLYSFTITSLMLSQAGAPFLIAIGLDSATVEYRRLCEIPNTTGNITITGTVEQYLDAGGRIYPLYYSTHASKTLLAGAQYTRFHGRLITTTLSP